MGVVGFVIGLAISVTAIILLILGFSWLWTALAVHGILGIVVFLIFFIVMLPITIILIILALIPMVIGGSL